MMGLGTWLINDCDSERMVDLALEAGYRHIDTAAIYENEAGVGRGIASSGVPRDKIFVTTKLWNSDQDDPSSALHASLERLGLDHVDLYLIHWPVPEKHQFDDAWRGLIKLRDEGLATSIGVSNFNPAHLEFIIKDTGVVPAVNQIELHPTFGNKQAVAANAKHGIVTESWSPLGRAEDLTNPVIQEIADRRGITLAQVIIAWHIAKGYVVFPKTLSPQRLVENFASQAVQLSPEDIAAIDDLDDGNRQGGDPETFGGPTTVINQ
jgi:2,5-diketo-D-gluconate reductase A